MHTAAYHFARSNVSTKRGLNLRRLLKVEVVWGATSQFAYDILNETRKSTPWQTNGIRLTFDGPVVASQGDLTITQLNGAVGDVISFSAFMGSGTNVLEWTISTPWKQSRMQLDFTNAQTESLVALIYKVLWGDINGDGSVLSNDGGLVTQMVGGTTPTTIYADVNGDGTITLADRTVVSGRTGTTLTGSTS